MNVYSLHIEKCGGTTVEFLLKEAFGDSYVAASYGQPAFCEDASQKEFPDGSMFHGHYNFNAHLYHTRTVPIEYITVLREPADRFVSHYYHAATRKDHHQFTVATGMSLTDYLVWAGGEATKNLMTFRLSSMRFNGSNELDALEQAWANLQSCAVVGLVEHLDDYIEELCRRYQLTKPEDGKRNVGKRKQLHELDDNLIAKVREANNLDCELYRRLIELLVKRNDTLLRNHHD